MASIGRSIASSAVQIGGLMIAYGIYVVASGLFGAAMEPRANARVVAVDATCRIVSARPDLYNPDRDMTCADAEQVRIAAIPSERVRIVRKARATLEFVTGTGQQIRAAVPLERLGRSSAKVGQRLSIGYDKSNPSSVRAPGRSKGGGGGMGWIVSGIVLVLIGRGMQGSPSTSRTAGGAAEALSATLRTLAKAAESVQAGKGLSPGTGKGGEKLRGIERGKGVERVKIAERAKVADRAKGASRPAERNTGYRPVGTAHSRAAKPSPRVLAKNVPRVVSPRRSWLGRLFS